MKTKAYGSNMINLGIKHASIASFVALAKMTSAIMGGIMLILVARMIGPVQYGIYTIAIAVAGLLASFGSINAGLYFNKHIPKLISENKFKDIGILICDVILFLFLLSFALIFIGGIFAVNISQSIFQSSSYTLIIYIALLSITWSIIYPALTAALINFGTAKEVGLSSASGLVIQSVLSIALAALGFGAVGIMSAYVISVFLATIISMYFIFKHVKLRFVLHGILKRMHEMLVFSIPLTVSSLLISLLNNFVVILLALLLISTTAIGQYGIATKVGQVFDIASGAIGSVLVAMFATAIYNRHHISKIEKLYQNSVYYSLIFTMPLVAYASILSKDIVITVFTSAYNLAILYMPLVSVGILLNLVWNNAFALIVSLGRVKRVLKFSIVACVIQLVSMIVFGMLFGILGVILGYFYIGNMAFLALYFKELYKFKIKLKYVPLLRVIFSNLIFGIALIPLIFLQIRPLYCLMIGMAIFLVLYPIALIKTRAVSYKEINVLYKVSNQVPLCGSLFRAMLRYSQHFL